MNISNPVLLTALVAVVLALFVFFALKGTKKKRRDLMRDKEKLLQAQFDLQSAILRFENGIKVDTGGELLALQKKKKAADSQLETITIQLAAFDAKERATSSTVPIP